MSHYMVYWKPETVQDNAHHPSLEHSASNQYGKLQPGDVLWIVTSENPDDLVLVGRQKVDRIVGALQAKSILGTDDLWAADYHAICDRPEDKGNLDISRRAIELTFDGSVTQLPEGFTGQNLQAMRRLDFDSASLLERLWRDRNQLFGD